MGNIYLSDDESVRLQGFFENKKRDDNYYVYALCENGKPFYVGKGIGLRCLQHEDDLEAIVREYSVDGTDAEELKDLKKDFEKELSNKLKQIGEAKQLDSFDVAIIKFGLTEHEAFMVESSVINSLKFVGVELTNIVNGHSSKREKETGESTKARYVKEVLSECCPKPIRIKDIKAFVENADFPFSLEKDDIVFISYNKYYPYCQNDVDTWDTVRGCWRMDESKAKKAKYVFAMHNNTIKGIFKVKKDGCDNSDFQKINAAEKPLLAIASSNVYVVSKSQGDILVIDKVIDLLKKEPSLKRNSQKLFEKLKLKEKAFYERGFYFCDIAEYNEDEDLLKIRNEFLNCYVKKEDLKMPQGSFTFLYSKDK